MKKGILISSTLGVALLSAILIVGANGDKEYYQPRTAGIHIDEGANGAIEWLQRRRVNHETGKIDPADVIAARQQTAALKAKNSRTTLHWGEMGPDNIGGRTRAILIDKDNPNLMFAGSVSGGLFKTTNGGSTWSTIDDFNSNLSVVSICQTSDGTIYYGTGEGIYYSALGIRSMGIIGGGIFKSTDGGNTFQVLPQTVPTSNSNGSDFASVGKLAADPNNPNRVYAATNNGLWYTDDAGANWDPVFSGGFANTTATDLVVTSSGKVWVKMGLHVYRSDNGNPGTYVQVTQLPSQNDQSVFRGSPTRIRMAVSPQDENYVYAIATEPSQLGATFRNAWRSTDGGDTWTKIGTASVQFNPHRDQGHYNNAVAVDPQNKDRIIVGGVELWEWSLNNGWLMIASLSQGVMNPLYVHADDHEIKFHPNNPDIIYIGNDGGVFRSTNGGNTWDWIVKNYITTQYYNIAVGPNLEVMGGTQDNGTILLDPNAPLPRSGIRTPGISYNGAVRDGDGGYAEISKLDPNIRFKAMQYGIIGRSINAGETYEFVLSDEVNPTLNAGARAFADFVTPFALWEKRFDPLSEDSITFIADSGFVSVGFGNNRTSFTGVVPRPQPSSRFIPGGLVIRAGNAEIRSDANGSLNGDGSGTFDPATGQFSVVFNNPVNLEITAKAAVRYEVGDSLLVQSATNQLPIPVDSLPIALEPLDTFMIQDPVQSMFVAGVTAHSPAPGSPDQNEVGGIWMTRDALSNTVQVPVWHHIAKLGNGVTPSSLVFSPDGDDLYVGTNNGVLYRLSNLHAARDSASTSVNDFYIGGIIDRPASSVIEKTVIKNFNGRTITDIAIHPDSSDLMVVTLGNYGETDYVYFTDSATFIGKANFEDVSLDQVITDLPDMPIYTATFNYKAGSFNEVFIGTDMGVFATDNINPPVGTSSQWRQENAGMANVPVFDLVQQRTVRYDIKDTNDYEGFLYAGTHGRGIFMTTSTSGNVEVSNPEEDVAVQDQPQLGMFPNPARDFTSVELQLENKSDVTITIRSITGKLVKSLKMSKVDPGVENIRVDVSKLGSGTYILTLMEGERIRSGKLIITK